MIHAHRHDVRFSLSLQDVTLDNVEEYIDLVMDFCFNSGIRRQMEAFRGLWHGFCPWIVCLLFFLLSGRCHE